MDHDTFHDHDHDRGLAHDLDTLLRQAQGRRGALRWLGAGAVLALGACGGGSTASGGSLATSGSTATAASTSSGGETCSVIPTETAGPYPGDGTNGPNALALSGIVRSDIVSSFAGASGSADGVPLTVRLQLANVGSSCASLSGLAVYLWHCDQLGRYSMYSSGVTGENYLRGVQVSDSSGEVTFTTIVPACYDGRWPHIHFEVYPSLASATSGSNDLKTSQLALPQALCDAVYADPRYTDSASNLAQTSLASDMVFSDGSSLQLPTVSGSVASGYEIRLAVGVQA